VVSLPLYLCAAGDGNHLMQEPSPWEHDNALTLYATHGYTDPRVVVYDHIEVICVT